MNRRQVLRRLAVAGSVSVSGCSSVLGSETTVLGRIEVVNFSLVANRLRLLVTREDDNENLLDRMITLPAVNAENGTPGVVIEPTWPETQGEYTVLAVHYGEDGDRETEDWEYTFTQEDYNTYYDEQEDPGCIGAIVKIGSLTDMENGTIGIGPTYMENPCGTQDSRQGSVRSQFY
ncbi:hypothetical protein [Haloplanus litoreus]|uniref:Uncharacterized protein n=2 Tax=Haloplanus litoreus TaxID=767515 RepID=A0ABD5ZZW5_9EURY